MVTASTPSGKGRPRVGRELVPGEQAPPKRIVLRAPGTVHLISVLALLVAWQIIGAIVGGLSLATPTATASALVSLFAHGGLVSATMNSLWVFALGFVLSAVLGVGLGVFLGYFKGMGEFSEVPINVFWATPVVALIPLFVIWFGLSIFTQVVIVFLSTFLPVVMNTQVGVRTVDPIYLQVAQVFGKSRWHLFTRVIMPAAVPHIGSGLRIGVGRAVIGVFVAELFTSVSGLGAKMNYYSSYFQTANYFAALVVFVLMAVVATSGTELLVRRWTRWQDR